MNPHKARDLVFVASSLRLQEEVHRIDRIRNEPARDDDVNIDDDMEEGATEY